jgi:hypothetical protein
MDKKQGNSGTWIHRIIMPPAAKNPFVKGFLDLPKLFIRYFSLPYLLALLRVSSRLTKIGGGFGLHRAVEFF